MKWDEAKMLESVGGDQELLDELLALFVDTMEIDLKVVRAGITEQDGLKSSEAAHSIKGAAMALDFEAISTVAEQIEKACKADNFSSVPQNIEQLSSLLEEVKKLC